MTLSKPTNVIALLATLALLSAYAIADEIEEAAYPTAGVDRP